MHFLSKKDVSAEKWNHIINEFDVEGLAKQLDDIGAGYFTITIGQGSGHYCAPNAVYDNFTGIQPSKCSKRDLILDLYDALHKKNIPLMVYTPAEGPFHDHEARKGLKMIHHWSDPDHNDDTDWSRYRQIEFMQNWEKVLIEWSNQWGEKVKGWWVDGCFHKDKLHLDSQAPNLASLADALKSGNPNAIVAFNPGVKVPVIAYSKYEDYTAGEISDALPLLTEGNLEWTGTKIDRFLEGEQYHILTFLGEQWSQGAPRFNADLTAGYTQHINSHGGVVSWDVPHNEKGLMPENIMKILAKIKKA